jgi:hypothetical protein
MAQLTPEQFAAKLREKAKAIALNAPLQIAAQSVHADRVIRIFSSGIAGASYNKTNELYMYDKDLRRNGNHEGKPFDSGRTVKSGKNKGKSITWTKAQNKTTYFKSYYDLKREQGFNPDTVNMRLTNDLQSDFANSAKTNSAGVPPTGDVIKVNNDLYVESLRRPLNALKLEKHVDTFGNFVAFTQKEKDDFQRIYTFEMTKLLQS